jgi:hypothetical protein
MLFAISKFLAFAISCLLMVVRIRVAIGVCKLAFVKDGRPRHGRTTPTAPSAGWIEFL